jgi:hypothetical protein
MAQNVHERLKELATEYGLPIDAERPMEFFFYAATADAAANLSVRLHELGYTLYGSSDCGPVATPVSITGHTPMMSTDSAVIAAWYEAMCDLAESVGCIFDGYGTLITESKEGWDAIL